MTDFPTAISNSEAYPDGGRGTVRAQGALAPSYRFIIGLLIGVGASLCADLMTNAIVDPFDRHPIINLPFHREAVSLPINRRLYKLQQFVKDPQPNVIIGDSVGDLLQPLYFRELGAQGWGNASFGGASIFEQYDTLRFLQSVRPIKRAVVTLKLRVWNDGYDINQVPEAVDLIEHPVLYYTSLTVLDASIANIENLVTGHTEESLPPAVAALKTPEARRKAFWPYPIKAEQELLENWRAPTAAAKTFLDMVDFAKANHIELTILLAPEYDAMRDVALQTHGPEYRAFRDFIGAHATVLDFDVPSAVTADESHWRDPAHFYPDVAREIVKGIVTGKSDVPFTLSCPNGCTGAVTPVDANPTRG